MKMTGIEDKISLLKRIAHRLNEAQVEWCLGASMMLYFKGIVSEFHDIDLMISVDVMAGFAIVREGEIYDCSLRKDQISDQLMLDGEVIPMQSPRLWCRYYRLMGRSAKADMIEKALEIADTDRGGK